MFILVHAPYANVTAQRLQIYSGKIFRYDILQPKFSTLERVYNVYFCHIRLIWLFETNYPFYEKIYSCGVVQRLVRNHIISISD